MAAESLRELGDPEAFELLERRSDGVTTWRGSVNTLAAARALAQRIAVETGHRVFAVRSDGTRVPEAEERAA